MNDFEKWMQTGPLAGEQINERTRLMLSIAFVEGRRIQNEDGIAALDRITHALAPVRPAA